VIRAQERPLAQTRPGGRYRIVAVQDQRCAEHLLRMGLVEGTIVDCVRNLYRGPVVVRCGRARMAVGRRIAEQVLVRDVSYASAGG
jgi:Fe2+ transport system protein FeoA